MKKRIEKAVILAGGKGKRMHSLTKETPKVLLEVGGKPVIEHQISLLEEQGVKEIWILLGHLGERVRNYLGNGSKFGTRIRYIQESRPLGTAGALIQLKNKIKEDLLVLSGDVIMHFDFQRFMDYHLARKESAASFVVHPTDHPKDSDLVEIDKQGRIVSLFKRPHQKERELGNLSIASVFIFSPRIFRFIDKKRKFDIEKDMLPKLLESEEKTFGYLTQEYIKDMGTPERLERVKADYLSGRVRKFNWQKKTYGA